MNLLAQIETQSVDYSGLKMFLPISGGINSAACLCWLLEEIPVERWPDELHLYYSHFKEHSPGTLKFVLALVKYAKGKFPDLKFTFTRNSVNKYFVKSKMIPHPTISPCSRTRSSCKWSLSIFQNMRSGQRKPPSRYRGILGA
jgi:hypothetical protein